MEFAVHEKNQEEGKGSWVLEVDVVHSRFLLTDEKGAFRWAAIADCTLLKFINPELPRPVVLVQMQPSRQGLVTPQIHLGNGKS